MNDYTDKDHYTIAEFAGVWKPGQKCQTWWNYLHPKVGDEDNGEWHLGGCEHGYSDLHDISPTPLDDALAMICIDHLPNDADIQTSFYFDWDKKKWCACIYSVVQDNIILGRYADRLRDAIFTAVLGYLKLKE